jgi:hypothetical protein
LNKQDLKLILRDAIDEHHAHYGGGVAGYASSVRLSGSFLHDVLHDRREFSDRLLRILGYQKQVSYIPLED